MQGISSLQPKGTIWMYRTPPWTGGPGQRIPHSVFGVFLQDMKELTPYYLVFTHKPVKATDH